MALDNPPVQELPVSAPAAQLDRHCDLAILGAGPAGLAAAEAAVRLGLNVVLFERHKLGGNSLNAGSISSKAIIETARVYQMMRDAAALGATAPNLPAMNFAAVVDRMRGIRARIASYQSVDRLLGLGVDVVHGDAHFVGRNALACGNTRWVFKKALVATGAQPRPSNIPGLKAIGFQTSVSVFEMAALPKSLAIIGGGPLGCELAQTFCRLGANVTIIQNEPKFLPREERDAAELLSRAMAQDGVIIRLNTAVVSAEAKNGVKILNTVSDANKSTVTADEIVLCTGRVPNVDRIGLDSAAIEFDAELGITTDEWLCTTNADVFAAGDVCMERKFTNIAQASAQLAVQNAFTAPRGRRGELIAPWCTSCDPEIAHIGLQVWEARLHAVPIKSYTVMMQDVDRAITDGQDAGFVKIHVTEGGDRILGATIVASRASEMINEVAVAMTLGIGLRALARVLHTYPAQCEAIRMAAVDCLQDLPPS